MKTKLIFYVFCISNFMVENALFSQALQWQPTAVIAGGPINSITISSGNLIFAASRDSGVLRSSNMGQSWKTVNHDLEWILGEGVNSILSNSEGALFAGSLFIYRSTNHGDDWVECSTVPDWFKGFGIDTSGNIFAVSALRVWRSTDAGLSWASIDSLIPLDTNSLDNYQSITIDQENHIFVGHNNGVLISTNEGDTWTNSRVRFGGGNPINAIHSSSVGTIFTGGFDGIFRSTDDGLTWVQVSGTIPFYVTQVQSIISTKSNIILAGTDNGVCYSIDNGSNWLDFGLRSYSIRALAIDSSGFVYAGTDSGIVFRSTQSVTSVSIKAAYLPGSFALGQNYPNPFNPATVIQYSVPVPGFVTLTLFNVVGEKIQILVSENMEPGKYNVKFDGGRLPSGIYFYRLKEGFYVATRKMVLIK